LNQHKLEDRFQAVSSQKSRADQHPAWSPDNRFLSWSSISDTGLRQIMIWDSENPDRAPVPVGSGDWPVWSGSGSTLYSSIKLLDGDYLTAYPASGNLPFQISLPPVRLEGEIEGLTWAQRIPSGAFALESTGDPDPLWEVEIDSEEENPTDRYTPVDLPGVEAPYALLHDLADESFAALRAAVLQEAGWDFLKRLENAYIPLTAYHEPGLDKDWLFTGRAFNVSDLPYQANWMIVVREDITGQTCWRIYLKALDQTGSMGQPLKSPPWYFDPWHVSPGSYEKGGVQSSTIPTGYWIDFTSLANAYGWERLPALPTWGGAVRTTRFQKFVFRQGLSWYEAMLQLYPPEALLTPTADVIGTPGP
jgi:TolB protein